MGTNGDGGIHLYRTNLSTTMNGTPLQANEKIVQNGREVYKWATRTVPTGIKELLHTANMQKDDIDWFIPHSANLRMIESICEKSQIQYKNINECGIYGEYIFRLYSTRTRFS